MQLCWCTIFISIQSAHVIQRRKKVLEQAIYQQPQHGSFPKSSNDQQIITDMVKVSKQGIIRPSFHYQHHYFFFRKEKGVHKKPSYIANNQGLQ